LQNTAIMHQKEHVPSKYTLAGTESSDASITLKAEGQGAFPATTFTFEALRPNIFRTTFTSPSHPLPPHPSVLKPSPSFGTITPQTSTDGQTKTILLGAVQATIDFSGAPLVSLEIGGYQVHTDLPFRSYALDSTGIAHYTHYKRNTLHIGLGEKAAPMNLSNRFFHIAATDSFGYDAYRTDPLYKHIPLLINVTPQGCVAIFSSSHSRATWAVGSEIEGLWGHFKVYRQDYGGLEEYLIVGKSVQEVVRGYAELAGFPKLVPRWALGYLAGGMKYSMLDSPRACDAHIEFVNRCREHDIPVSGFQMSSGYTIAETEPKTRNVFTWNRHRFPDPRAWTKETHAHGVRLIANVKPYILATHPAYIELKDAGGLFRDPHTGSAEARLWSAGGGESGVGGHIDFTSKKSFSWWYNGVAQLRREGIDAMWNDNNEICIPDDEWELSLQNEDPAGELKGNNTVGLWGRALHTELMGKSSHDALVSVEPKVRPFVLTRSATAGTMRYAASSWSGDNVTSWAGMKGANAISLNAGVSLLQVRIHLLLLSPRQGPLQRK
jgi:alpha-glucosidase (family GH31 glycosyl hydrolase)